jgi:hypothetical protein
MFGISFAGAVSSVNVLKLKTKEVGCTQITTNGLLNSWWWH